MTPSNSNESEIAPPSPVIVIGFVGGFNSTHDNTDGVVQFAGRLRDEYGSSVHVEVFQNHHRLTARRRLLELLDLNHDGKLSPEEKQNARIILYGESWGGSETVALAGELERRAIPVLITAQIDSVNLAKFGHKHKVIPANVAEAISFYQPHGLAHGPHEIRAADPQRTHIVGNFRFDYRQHPIRCERYSWYERCFGKDHMEIECDSKVWNKVDALIHSQVFPEREEAASSGLDLGDPLRRSGDAFYERLLQGIVFSTSRICSSTHSTSESLMTYGGMK